MRSAPRPHLSPTVPVFTAVSLTLGLVRLLTRFAERLS
jgi:hypothetical protein